MRFSGVVPVLIVYRCICALLQQTAFAPDEFWQGPEVAHRLVFGYGHVTWEWVVGIRSYVHPLMYAVVYQLLRWAGMDGWRWVMVKGPQMVHVMLTVWADISVYKLTRVYLEDEGVAVLALVCQLLNWFGSYCLVRTFSNSVEACLTAYALYAYAICLKNGKKQGSRVAHDTARYTVYWVFCAALCVVLRPASGVFWGILAVYSVVFNRGRRALHIMTGLLVGCLVLFAASSIDRWMYGRWELVPWNFFKFNVLSDGSSLYGVNPWHANFSTHLPSMLLSYIPFFLLGCITCMRQGRWHLVGACVLYCVVYSIPAHKEIRFLLPALIMCMPVTALGLKQFLANRAHGYTYTIMFSLQLTAFAYFSLLHQRGQVQVMKTVYDLGMDSVLFLTPCHATPYYSSLHVHKHMRFMDCSPQEFRDAVYQANRKDMEWIRVPGYDSHVSSERYYFENNPAKVLSSILSNGTVPDVIVSFASTSQEILPVLGAYRLHTRQQNCLITFEENTDCLIDVFVRR